MPHFETFDPSASPQGEPQVTLQRRGSLSLNRAAFLALGSPDSVELLYDRAAGVIGLRRTTSKGASAVHVRTSPRTRNGPWLVSARAFTKFYDIDVSVTRRWAAYLDGAILCVDLSGTPVATRGSAGHARPNDNNVP